MPSLRTINISEMRAINRSAVLDLVRRESPISRTEIAERLDVSLPTVMRILDELIEENLVVPDDGMQSGRGRPRALVRFNETGFVVLGVDLGGTKMYGAVADLGGNILHEEHLERHGTSGEDSYRTLVALIEKLLTSSHAINNRILGVGVGAPGETQHNQGVVTWAPSLNWRDFPLKEKLRAEFGLPVIIENDVNLAALGELWFGVDNAPQNMVLIAIGTGIGAGVIIDGALYRGSFNAAGEVGYMIFGRDQLGQHYEHFGAFEALASGTGIAQRANGLKNNGALTKEAVAITSEDVFEALQEGEPWARTIIAETVDYWAMAIVGISAVLDPELIILSGGVIKSGKLIEDMLNARLRGAIPRHPQVMLSRLGSRAAVLGTITSVLHYTEGHYVVRKLT